MSGDPRALQQQAEAAEKKASGGFSFFGGKQDKLERAAELWTEAANAVCRPAMQYSLSCDPDSLGIMTIVLTKCFRLPVPATKRWAERRIVFQESGHNSAEAAQRRASKHTQSLALSLQYLRSS